MEKGKERVGGRKEEVGDLKGSMPGFRD